MGLWQSQACKPNITNSEYMYNTYMYLGDSQGNGYNDVRPTPLYSDHLSITTRLVHDLAWSQ